VAKPLLQRAFEDTYALKLEDVIGSVDLALGTYRLSVSTMIPEFTKVAWDLKKDDIVKATPGMTRKRFLYNISRQSFEKEWGRDYRRPGIGARVLAWVVRVVPKVGPLRALSPKMPTPQTALLFERSFNVTLDSYRGYLAHVPAGGPHLPDLDLDTGQVAHAGEYPLADKAYADLLAKLNDQNFKGVPPELRADILRYYENLNAPIATRKDAARWDKTLTALARLRALELPPTS
jgi:hypothetical protein